MPKFNETDDFVVDLRNQGKPSFVPTGVRTTAGKQLNTQLEPQLKESVVRVERAKKEERQSFDEQVTEAMLEDTSEEEPRFFKNANEPAFSFVDFMKYNNAFLIVLVVGVIAFSSLAFASEDIRDNTIGGKQVYAEGVDNTLLLNTDLDNFSMDFTINGITENEESFLVSYSYLDLEIQDGTPLDNNQTGQVWQIVEKNGGRKITKPFRRDLGLYLADQLSQEAKARIKELKKLKKEEAEKGQTKIVQVTKYSGLIGKVLDLSGVVFTGYEPVKKIELDTPIVDEVAQARTRSGSSDNLTNVYNNWVESHTEEVGNLNGETLTTMEETTETTETTETPTTTEETTETTETTETPTTTETTETTETTPETTPETTESVSEPASVETPTE